MQIDNMYEPAASFLFRAQIYKEDQGQATVFFLSRQSAKLLAAAYAS